jgi:hypothetical protein
MTRKWAARLLALGGLAIALGCRAHPRVPPCDTPLLPGEVVPGPVNMMPGPPVEGASPPVVNPIPQSNSPPGVQLPKPNNAEPGILPPGRFARLPEPTYPISKPPLEPVVPTPPPGVTDLPPVLSPPDRGPVKVPDALPAPGPMVIPPNDMAPRPKDADGFGPAPKIPAAEPEPDSSATPASATNPVAALPLKPGEKSGHAPDYRWVAGVLDRHSKGRYWTIRFADISTDDVWGGKVRLLDDERLRGLRDGDVVDVEGELMAPRSAADSTTYPPFRVTSLQLIERAR